MYVFHVRRILLMMLGRLFLSVLAVASRILLGAVSARRLLLSTGVLSVVLRALTEDGKGNYYLEDDA